MFLFVYVRWQISWTHSSLTCEEMLNYNIISQPQIKDDSVGNTDSLWLYVEFW